MHIPRKVKTFFRFFFPIMAIAVGIPLFQRSMPETEAFEGDSIRCAIALSGYNSPMNYGVGYNYELTHIFAQMLGKDIEIEIQGPGENYLDSLRDNRIDIYICRYADSLVSDNGLSVTPPLADSSTWVVRGRQKAEHLAIIQWQAGFKASEYFKPVSDRFTPAYEPYRRAASGVRYSTLSPYDEIIQKKARHLDWPRTTLTALIWQESRFRIEAHSRRGAVGLTQLMPKTADRFEAENLIDPEENLDAAVKYLGRLERMFRSRVGDKAELRKFVLGAYNAGEGRILDCINYAASIGAPHDTWNDILSVIPDMREDSILDADTVKLGKFKGYETIAYVDKIMELDSLFSVILSGPSSQDRHATRKDTVSAAGSQ